MKASHTLNFVFFKDEVILLNREKSPWMGMWNGLGGKINLGETLDQGIRRELFEELNAILDYEIVGSFRWFEDNLYQGNIVITKTIMNERVSLPEIPEGILAYKTLDWVFHPENKGISNNIILFLKEIVSGRTGFTYTSYYENDQYIKTVKEINR